MSAISLGQLQNRLNKKLSWLLSVLIALWLTPTAAFAQDALVISADQPNVFLDDDDYPDGGTLLIEDDVTVNLVDHYGYLGSQWVVTVDGTIAGGDSSVDYTTLQNGSTLIVSETGTVTDVHMEDGGTITNAGVIADNAAFYSNAITANNAGTLTINNSGTVAVAGIGDAISASLTTIELSNSGNIVGTLEFDSGNDVVNNSGTIDGDLFTGSGMDTVINSGEINGDIYLGMGNDSLILEGGSTINAIELISGGSDPSGLENDTLTLNGTGVAAFGFSGFETSTINGNWTFDSNSTSLGMATVTSGASAVFVGALNVSSLTIDNGGSAQFSDIIGQVTNNGTLEVGSGMGFQNTYISGDLQMNMGSALVFDISNTGAADHLYVSGSATLAGGTLVSVSQESDWSADQTYVLLTAGSGITGEFAAATNNLEYLVPTLEYSSTEVTLTLTRDVGAIQSDILSATTIQQASVSARVMPNIISSQIGTSLANSMGANRTVATRLMSNRTIGLSAGSASADQQSSGWINITPSRYKQLSTVPGAGLTKLDGEAINLLAGYDRNLGEKLVLGGFVGYEDSQIDIRAIGGRQENDGLTLGGYAGLVLTDSIYMSVNGHWASLSNSLEEQAFNAAAPDRANFDSSRYGVGVDINAVQAHDNWGFFTQFAYNYSRESYDRYTTSGGDVVDLQDVKIGRLSSTVEVSYAGDGWSPYLSATIELDVEAPDIVEDNSGIVVNAGVRIFGERFTLEAFLSSVEGRDNEDHQMIGINASYLF